jgi:hypothetical protein
MFPHSYQCVKELLTTNIAIAVAATVKSHVLLQKLISITKLRYEAHFLP